MKLYREYFIEREFEREDIFIQLQDNFHIERVLYPGSFVHVTPSFVFNSVCYVDSDKPTAKFFNSPELFDFISSRKHYSADPEIIFYPADYNKPFGQEINSFDLLISQYAGFISLACKEYLKPGGLLLANNSHGDAGMASIDRDFELVGVFIRRDGQYKFSTSNLEKYFTPKKSIEVSEEYLLSIGRGIGYTRTASNYLFVKK